MDFETPIPPEVQGTSQKKEPPNIMEGANGVVRKTRTGFESLDYTKVEGDENAPNYEAGIRSAIETYSIKDSAFSNPKEEVIQGAVRLLSGYEVDPLFTSIPERNLFALAISDAWLSTSSIKEKKALLDILKLVATGIKENQQFGTYSNKVKVLSEHGIPRGTEFNPEFSIQNTYSEYVDMLIRYIQDNVNDMLTKEVSAILEDWSDNSKLGHVRKKLGITDRKSERPFNVVVLNKTAQQMYDEVGYTSLYVYISSADNLTIVFNSNYKEADSLEHEYAHSQSVGLHRWYRQLLFRGVNEALTERATSNPTTYPEQRKFLDSFINDHPEYEELMYKAYVGDEEARSKLFSLIVNDYDLTKFLIFARVAPIDNPKLSGYIGESIYIKPDVALSVLRKKDK